jgi:hypothetical protein
MKNHVWQKVIQNQVVHVIVAVERVIIPQIVMPQHIKMGTTFESNPRFLYSLPQQKLKY